MLKIKTLEDILALKEDFDIEFKSALGRDGNGKLPDDFFETYSAMANSGGGSVFLGIEEKSGVLNIVGIKEPNGVKKELFDNLNNKQKVNSNILSNSDIDVLSFEDKQILHIRIPPATREQKPIHKGQNPLHGTYIRQHEGDYRCGEEVVKRMLAEQIEDSRDSRALRDFGFDDIDLPSFYAYRNIFKANQPDHPWNALNDIEFLRSLGGYRLDRQTKDEGLTVAGLLMFGKSVSIEEQFPYYNLDYQERPRAKTELRWIDRVTVDGTWSGNVFDFYRVVIKKLFADLKVPFRLDSIQRQDNTPVHQSIREAFINTLVHADYSDRLSILVVKRPDMFGFRNPGLMRVPLEVAIRGGESDCRNRTLQKMFTLIGYCERAGSGIPKIYSGWDTQNWTKPLLYEKSNPDQTLLELRMVNLLDEQIIEELRELYGASLEKLSKDEMLILATAYIEEGTNHKRVSQLLDLHPSDISNILKKLVCDGLLSSEGIGRGTIYQARGVSDEARGVAQKARGVSDEAVDFDAYYTKSDLPSKITEHIDTITERLTGKQRVKMEVMQEVIFEICQYGYFSPELLSLLIGKGKDRIKDIVSTLINEKKLKKLYELPNHPKQAYMATYAKQTSEL